MKTFLIRLECLFALFWAVIMCLLSLTFWDEYPGDLSVALIVVCLIMLYQAVFHMVDEWE